MKSVDHEEEISVFVTSFRYEPHGDSTLTKTSSSLKPVRGQYLHIWFTSTSGADLESV